jgi:uncharacterized membrane protein
MSELAPKPTEDKEARVEALLGNVLRAGVIGAAAVALIGGAVFLIHHGREIPDYHVFRGEPDELRSPAGIIAGALTGSGRGIIQTGLLLLIATPVLRVAFSAAAFAWQRDYLYVVLTLFVLGLLLWSLFS